MKVCEEKDYCYIEMPEKKTFIKYKPGVKSMKPHLLYLQTQNVYLEKWILVVMIQANHQQKGKKNMKCMNIHCLQAVHLMKKIINWIIIEVKIV